MSESKAADSPTAPRRADYRPAGVDRKTGFFATLKRAVTEFSEDNLTDWAAALTYYGLLSLFPALIALVAVLGLFGDPAATTAKITEIVTKIGPSSAADTFSGPIKSITSNRSAAGVASDRRARARALVGLWIRRRLHERLERDLRDTRGPAVLEAAPAADAGDPGDGRS